MNSLSSYQLTKVKVGMNLNRLGGMISSVQFYLIYIKDRVVQLPPQQRFYEYIFYYTIIVHSFVGLLIGFLTDGALDQQGVEILGQPVYGRHSSTLSVKYNIAGDLEPNGTYTLYVSLSLTISECLKNHNHIVRFMNLKKKHRLRAVNKKVLQ